MTTRDALNSTVFLALARLGVPVLLAGNIAAGSYWANIIYERQETAFTRIGDLEVAQGKTEVKVGEHERRLNSRRSPISDTRDLYSIGAP